MYNTLHTMQLTTWHAYIAVYASLYKSLCIQLVIASQHKRSLAWAVEVAWSLYREFKDLRVRRVWGSRLNTSPVVGVADMACLRLDRFCCWGFLLIINANGNAMLHVSVCKLKVKFLVPFLIVTLSFSIEIFQPP